MSVVIIDGRVRVTWMTACANILAPTVAELNAGTALQSYITPDGLDIQFETGKVDVGNVASTYTLERVGRRKPAIKLTMHHDSPTDTPWTLLVYRAVGYLAVRTGIDTTTAWTIGQGGGGSTGSVQVFPVEAGQDSPVNPAPDSTWDFTTDLTVYLDPSPRSVVA